MTETFTRIIDRVEELRVLAAALKELHEKRGQTILLEGAMGVGKTRILFEFMILEIDLEIIYAYPGKEASPIPLSPILQGVRNALEVSNRPIPELLKRFVAPSTDRSGSSPHQGTEEVFVHLAEGLLDWAQSAPLVLILDNLQWADPASLALFHFLSRAHATHPILMIGALRPEELTGEVLRTVQLMNRERLVQKEQIKGLSRSETREFISKTLGESVRLQELFIEALTKDETQELLGTTTASNSVDDRLAAMIYEVSQGNPLLSREIVHELLAKDAIRVEGGILEMVTDDLEAVIPRSLAEAIREKLAVFPDEALEILRLGAMLGEEFPYDLLDRVLPYSEEELSTLLDQVIRGFILEEHEIKREERFRFSSHELFEFIKTTIPQNRVAATRRQVADFLSDGRPLRPEEVLQVIDIRAEIGDLERAADFIDSGIEITRISGAVPAYQRYLRYSLDLPEGTITAPSYSRPERLIQLADSLIVTGDYDEAVRRLYSAESSLASLADPGTLTGRVAYHRAQIAFAHYETSNAEADLDLAAEIFSEAGDDRGLVDVAVMRCWVWNRVGRFTDSMTALIGAIPNAEALANRSFLASLYDRLGAISMRRGDRTESVAYYQDAERLFRQQGNRKLLAGTKNGLGCCYLEFGDFELARLEFQDCIRLSQEANDSVMLIRGTNGLAQVMARIGDLQSGAALAAEGRVLAERLSHLDELAEVNTIEGVIAHRQGDLDLAKIHLEKAIRLGKEIGDEYYTAQYQYELARVQHDQGLDSDAAPVLMEAIAAWNQFGAKHWLERCSSLGLELGLEMARNRVPKDVKASISYRSVLIGREEEIGRLVMHYDRAAARNGNLIFIEGEAGVGKTRLAIDFLENFAVPVPTTLFARGIEGSSPYFSIRPILETLGQTGLVSPIDPPLDLMIIERHGRMVYHVSRRSLPPAPEPILKWVREHGPEQADGSWTKMPIADTGTCLYFRDPMWQIIVTIEDPLHQDRIIDQVFEILARSSIADLLDNITDSALNPKRPRLDLASQKDRSFQAILESLCQRAKRVPVVIFFDDLQWIDKASLDLFGFLVKNTRDQPILCLGTFRPEDLITDTGGERTHPLSRVINDLAELKLYSKLVLELLTDEQVSAMIESMLGTIDFPPHLIPDVYAQSKGNPFFIEEIIDTLIEDGIVYQAGDVWKAAEFSAARLPQSIGDIILRRLDHLDESTKKVLNYGSVIGIEFDFDTILSASNIDEEDLLVDLDRLVKTRFLKELGNEIYAFDHETTQRVVHANLSNSILKILHKKVGMVIEEAGDPASRIFELARHFRETRDSNRAFKYAVLAATLARTQLAPQVAIGHLEIALKILPEVETIPKVSFVDGNSRDEISGQLNREFGEILESIGDNVAAMRPYLAYLESAREQSDQTMEADARLRLGTITKLLGEYAAARDYLTTGLTLAKSVNDRAIEAGCERGLGYLLWRHGEHASAIERYNQAIRLSFELDDRHGMAVASVEMGNVYAHSLNFKRAREFLSKAIRDLEELKDYKELCRALNNLGDTFLSTKEWDRAIDYFEQCRNYAKKIGNQHWIAWSNFNSANAYTKKGELDIAEACCDRAFSILRPLDERIGLGGLYMNYGEIFTKRGDLDKAIEYHLKGIAVFEELNIPFELAEGQTALGVTYLAKGDQKGAKEVIEAAASNYRKIGLKEKAQESLNLLADAEGH